MKRPPLATGESVGSSYPTRSQTSHAPRAPGLAGRLRSRPASLFRTSPSARRDWPLWEATRPRAPELHSGKATPLARWDWLARLLRVSGCLMSRGCSKARSWTLSADRSRTAHPGFRASQSGCSALRLRR
ncbi:hypothetical protein MHYP_G00143950 [Metynnis hypsauchen]